MGLLLAAAAGCLTLCTKAGMPLGCSSLPPHIAASVASVIAYGPPAGILRQWPKIVFLGCPEQVACGSHDRPPVYNLHASIVTLRVISCNRQAAATRRSHRCVQLKGVRLLRMGRREQLQPAGGAGHVRGGGAARGRALLPLSGLRATLRGRAREPAAALRTKPRAVRSAAA